MKFYTLLTLFLAFGITAFSSNPDKKGFYQDEKQIKNVVLTPSNFEKNASKYIGRTVEVTGIVDHICKHGGKKMFLVDEKSKGKIKVTLGDDMAALTQELVGETVKVTGVVEVMEVDEEYLNKMENNAKNNVKQKGDGLHLENGENKDHEEGNQSEKIENLRKMLKESGEDHLSFFSIKALDYEVVK